MLGYPLILYGLLRCPLCHAPMYRMIAPGRDKARIWACGGKKGCPPYVIREQYIDHAIRDALRGISDEELKAVMGSKGADVGKAVSGSKGAGSKAAGSKAAAACAPTDASKAEAAWAALEWKKKPLKTIEFCMLDDLISKIDFVKWDQIKIVWKFGMTTTVPIEYEKESHVPLAKIEKADGKTLINGAECSSAQVVFGIQYKQRFVSDLQVKETPTLEGQFCRPQVFAADSKSKERVRAGKKGNKANALPVKSPVRPPATKKGDEAT